MKRLIAQPLIPIVVVAALLTVAALLLRRHFEDKEIASLTIEHSNAIDITPAQIRSIERIGQWEFLVIDDEEMVDSVRRRTLGRDDRLTRIYQGRLRLGINMDECSADWVLAHGDTVSLTLPRVGLLSNHFIDEARTRSFYESGQWDARAKEQMYRKAVVAMRRRCLTPANLRQTEDNAREQFTALFRTLGFNHVEVRFANVNKAQKQ